MIRESSDLWPGIDFIKDRLGLGKGYIGLIALDIKIKHLNDQWYY